MNKDLASVKSPALRKAGTQLNRNEKDGINSFIGGLAGKEDNLELDVKPTRMGSKSRTFVGGNSSSAKKVQISKFNADDTDRIYDLERENTILKSKENILESEITKMKTKLRRIDELLRKKGKNASESQRMMPSEVERHLQDEIDKLIEENSHIKERNSKLRAIETSLASGSKPPATKKAVSSMGKFSAAPRPKMSSTANAAGDRHYAKLLEELKVQLVAGERQVVQLTTYRDKLQANAPGGGRSDVQLEIDGAQRELGDIHRRIAEMRTNLVRDETMFGESKSFMERKQQEINDLSRECENLSHKNF